MMKTKRFLGVLFTLTIVINLLPQLASSAENIPVIPELKTYSELKSEYDNFVYYGIEVIEVSNGKPTDGYVSAGDWLEYRLTLLSDLYIGASFPYIVFDNNFFDVHVITSTTPGYSYEEIRKFTDGTFMNPDHSFTAPNIDSYHTLTALTASTVSTQLGFCGIDSATYSGWDMVKSDYRIDTKPYNNTVTMTEDKWLVSWYARVKENLPAGQAGFSMSPSEIWKHNLNPLTNKGDTRRLADVNTSNTPGTVSSAKSLAIAINSGLIEYVLLDDTHHSFVIEECTDTTPADHICDICSKTLSVCTDKSNDCACDVCGKIYVDIASGDISLTETNGVKYANSTAYEGELTVTDSDTSVANVLTIESGEHNVTIDSITVKQIKVATGAKLNLTLVGESTIKPGTSGLAAIQIPEDTELVITESSQGSVTATGEYSGAGIGGGDCENSGKITISGGTVTATGGTDAAGIGGGQSGNGTDITITGGVVAATGGRGGAGIGSGYYGNGTNITISGGTVTAKGGVASSGIGGGQSGNGTDITICGGTVTAISSRSFSTTEVAIGNGSNGSTKNIFVSPNEYCAIIVKSTEEATEIIGKYAEKTDVTSMVKSKNMLYIYTTTCGGNHIDEDINHLCDVCNFVISKCEDKSPADHICDICNQVASECDFDTNNGFCSVCGEMDVPELKDNYYQIENAGQLYWFANYINTVDRTANAVLKADIDLEGKSDGTGRKWMPIGSTGENSNNFRGHFDGKNHTITNLYIDEQRAGMGLFGEVRLGTVENFTIYGDVKLTSDCSYVGGVIGSAPGANGTDVPDHNGATIRNIISYVNVTLDEGSHGSSFVGGFMGYANHETIIENCSWYGTLDLGANRADSGVGGLVGRLYDKSNVTISNCGSYGTIKTSYKSGTYNNYDTIYIGGVLSFSPAKTLAVLENNLWAGEFIDDTDLGNKAHLSAFGTLNGEEVVTNCYAINSVPYLTTENVNSNGITTVTAQQLASGEIAYLLQGEQTTEVWGQDLSKENSLPVLGGDKVYFNNGIYYNEVKEFEILSNGTNGSKATATVAVPTAGTYTIIFSDYDGTKLNKMDSVTVTTESDNMVIIVPSEIDITLSAGDKIMLWQDMTNLVPKCETYILK